MYLEDETKHFFLKNAELKIQYLFKGSKEHTGHRKMERYFSVPVRKPYGEMWLYVELADGKAEGIDSFSKDFQEFLKSVT